MDVLLIGVSLVSTVVALVMTAVAWKVSRDQRAVSAARVAALSAAASDDLGQASEKPSPATTLDQFEPEPIAVGAARPAPWAASRISSFSTTRASALRPEPHEVTIKPVTIETPSPSPTISDGFLGGGVSAPTDSGRQRSLALAAIVLFGLVLVGGYWTVFGDRSSATTLSAANSVSPLELVSMRHERRGTRLAVTGLVRNPVAGAPVDRLAAVVFLFDEQGGFITSARANVDFLKLSPGDESPFVIDVEAPSSVARYRVSFRNDAGIVPHVDRRGQQPLAVSTVR